MSKQLVSQAEFSRMQNWDKSYVTRLKQSGRLVMDGGNVNVAESLRRIAETSSPGHANNGINSAGETQAPKSPADERITASYQQSKAVKERYLALQAKLDYEKASKLLVAAEDVRLFAADLGATFRAALEILPDRIAPELVAIQDVDGVRAVLVENFEAMLQNLAEKIEKGVHHAN